jgi:hypothetical protein
MPINPTTLKALIDTQITNETVNFAITPTEVGSRMKDTIDYTTEQIALKQDILESGTNIKTLNGESLLGSGNIESGGVLNYKILSFWMTISSGVLTVEEIENQFEATTFTYEIPTNGRISITASTSVFTSNKVSLERGAFGTASGGFFCRYVAATTSLGLVYFTRWDNDTTINPSISRLRIEIRVYE